MLFRSVVFEKSGVSPDAAAVESVDSDRVGEVVPSASATFAAPTSSFTASVAIARAFGSLGEGFLIESLTAPSDKLTR